MRTFKFKSLLIAYMIFCSSLSLAQSPAVEKADCSGALSRNYDRLTPKNSVLNQLLTFKKIDLKNVDANELSDALTKLGLAGASVSVGVDSFTDKIVRGRLTGYASRTTHFIYLDTEILTVDRSYSWATKYETRLATWIKLDKFPNKLPANTLLTELKAGNAITYKTLVSDPHSYLEAVEVLQREKQKIELTVNGKKIKGVIKEISRDYPVFRLGDTDYTMDWAYFNTTYHDMSQPVYVDSIRLAK